MEVSLSRISALDHGLAVLQATIRQRMLTLMDNVCSSAVPPTEDRRQESLLGDAVSWFLSLTVKDTKDYLMPGRGPSPDTSVRYLT